MSTIGTAPSQGVRLQKQPLQTVSPLAQATAPTILPLPNAQNTYSFNAENRIDRLLAQLENNPLALVPYGHGRRLEPTTEKTNALVIVLGLGCIWVSIVALGFVYFYSENPSKASESIVAEPRMSLSSNSRDQNTADIADRLSEVLISSSIRLNEMEKSLNQSGEDLQRVKTDLRSRVTRNNQTKATIVHAESLPKNQPTVANPTVTSVLISPAANAVVPPITNSGREPLSTERPSTLPYQVLLMRPTNSATPHNGSDGNIDYWLVSRGVLGMAKVLPIAVASNGIVVHNLVDGKNYTLTRQGQWHDVQ